MKKTDITKSADDLMKSTYTLEVICRSSVQHVLPGPLQEVLHPTTLARLPLTALDLVAQVVDFFRVPAVDDLDVLVVPDGVVPELQEDGGGQLGVVVAVVVHVGEVEAVQEGEDVGVVLEMSFMTPYIVNRITLILYHV